MMLCARDVGQVEEKYEMICHDEASDDLFINFIERRKKNEINKSECNSLSIKILYLLQLESTLSNALRRKTKSSIYTIYFLLLIT